MRIKFGLPGVGGAIFAVPSVMALIKGLVDWKGRYDAGISVTNEFPVWLYFVALVAGLLLIWWDSKRSNKEITIVISSLALAVAVSIVAACFWANYLYDRSQGPVIWLMGRPEYPIFDMRGGGGNTRPLITAFQFCGQNRYEEPIRSVSGNLRSNVTGKEYSLYFRIGGKLVKTEETHGIPGLITFMIIVPIADDPADFDSMLMPSNQFISQFGSVTLTVNLNGKSIVKRFSESDLSKVIDEFDRSFRQAPVPSIVAK